MDAEKMMKKNRLSFGEQAKILSRGKELKGTIIPGISKEAIVLKLGSGYNIGVKTSKIEKIEKIEGKNKLEKKPAGKMPFNPALPTIQVLHIGGTIASRVDYATGAVKAEFEPEDIIAMFPEISSIANFKAKKIAQIESENLRFGHYSMIAKEIAKACQDKSVKGIILPHGTDTMAYTSASLAFMLENIQIPVILVGAQRSTDRGSSDAAMNLICAAEFITKTDFRGIAICMHETMDDENCVILPACKTRKLHSSRRDAFKPVNDTPIARVNYKTRKIEFIKKDYSRREAGKSLKLREKMSEKVTLLKTHTNMRSEIFKFLLKEKYRGLVIEGTGLGQIPLLKRDEYSSHNEEIFKAVKKLSESGCIIVITTQTIHGRVQMHVYSAAVDLMEMGVIPGEDMLAETALVKLAWLLGNFPEKEARELMAKNLRGEITEFSKNLGE